MKQSEAAAQLRQHSTQLAKVRAEVQKLLDVANGDADISPELADAIQSVGNAIQGVDDLNPDVVQESPGEDSPGESPAGSEDGSNDAARR